MYVFLALVVNARLLTGFDRSTIEWLQTVIPRWLDLPFTIVSLIGSFEVTVVVIFAVLFFLFRPRYRVALFILFLALVGVEWMGKELIFQPGPPDTYARMVHLFTMPTGSLYTPYSFPSGHAGRSAFITLVVFAWIWQSRIGNRSKLVLVTLLVLAELIMLISRVYLGEHWSSDVIAGTVLGLLLALPAVSDALDPR